MTPCNFTVQGFEGIARLEKDPNHISGDAAIVKQIVGHGRYDRVVGWKQRS